MTIWQLITLIIVVTIGIVWSLIFFELQNDKTSIFIAITIIIAFIGVGVCYWYNQNTETGVRNSGEYQRELSNGVEREISIYSEDGREIYHYEGKINIDDTKSPYCLYFYDQSGKSYIIHYGIKDTVIITEIGEEK